MKNKKIINLILIVSYFVFISHSASAKTLNKQCLCDVSDQCDIQCCCDTKCDSSFVKKWNQYKLCLDDNFGIPFCSKLSQRDVNVLDLHSGLRTIYSVVKRLFCINSVNIIDPTQSYIKTVNDSDLQTQLSSISTAQSQSVLNREQLALTQIAISGLPLKNSNGLCRTSLQITKNNQQSSSCRVYVSAASDVANTVLSTSKLDTSLGVTLKKFTSKNPSSSSAVNQTLSTTCVANDCTNVVRQIRIFINSDTGAIDSNSYVVLGPLTVDQKGYISISYQYTFVKVDGALTLPATSNIGYNLKSKLNLMFKDSTNQYFKIMNPLNLAFRKPDGTCRTLPADESSNSFIQLNFGQNQVLSCYGTTNLIYNNLINAFGYIGKYGVSNNKINDYVSITTPASISSSQSVQLIIYYLNIGTPTNVQYQISKAQIRAITSKDSSSTLYVEYVDVGNMYTMYTPPKPTVDAYLPNDFLYPFFVA